MFKKVNRGRQQHHYQPLLRKFSLRRSLQLLHQQVSDFVVFFILIATPSELSNLYPYPKMIKNDKKKTCPEEIRALGMLCQKRK